MKNYGIVPAYMIPQYILINFNAVRNCDRISWLERAIDFRKRHSSFYSKARTIYSIDRLYSSRQEIPISAYKHCVNRNTPTMKGLVETYDAILPELAKNIYVRPTRDRRFAVQEKYLLLCLF